MTDKKCLLQKAVVLIHFSTVDDSTYNRLFEAGRRMSLDTIKRLIRVTTKHIDKVVEGK